MAAGRALLESKSDAGSNELIKAVVADFETSEGRAAAREGLQVKLKVSKPGELKSKIAAVCEASSLIDSKAPGDAAAFKTWLRHISRAVAEASREGGFLGFGGGSSQRSREGDSRPRFRRAWAEKLNVQCDHTRHDSVLSWRGRFAFQKRKLKPVKGS
jgi:hypothetical protein